MSNGAHELFIKTMESKLLIDLDTNNDPVIRVAVPKGDSDDLRDKTVKVFLEEVVDQGGLVKLHYNQAQDAILSPCEVRDALWAIQSHFPKHLRVYGLINSVITELNNLELGYTEDAE